MFAYRLVYITFKPTFHFLSVFKCNCEYHVAISRAGAVAGVKETDNLWTIPQENIRICILKAVDCLKLLIHAFHGNQIKSDKWQDRTMKFNCNHTLPKTSNSTKAAICKKNCILSSNLQHITPHGCHGASSPREDRVPNRQRESSRSLMGFPKPGQKVLHGQVLGEAKKLSWGKELKEAEIPIQAASRRLVSEHSCFLYQRIQMFILHHKISSFLIKSIGNNTMESHPHFCPLVICNKF